MSRTAPSLFSSQSDSGVDSLHPLGVEGAQQAGKGMMFFQKDNGGRRSGVDRRRFSYDMHIPERRCLEERRNCGDRRGDGDRRGYPAPQAQADRRTGLERRASFV